MDSTGSTGRAGRTEPGAGRTMTLRAVIGRLRDRVRRLVTTAAPARPAAGRGDTARGRVGPRGPSLATRPTQFIGVLPPDLWKETR